MRMTLAARRVDMLVRVERPIATGRTFRVLEIFTRTRFLAVTEQVHAPVTEASTEPQAVMTTTVGNQQLESAMTLPRTVMTIEDTTMDTNNNNVTDVALTYTSE